MHDCALGKEGGPSAPRVEHRYYANVGIKMHDCALGREEGPSAPRVEHRYYIMQVAEKTKS